MPRHILAWDSVRLRLDLDHVQRLLAERLARSGRVRNLRLGGGGPVLRLDAAVRWRGLELRLAVDLEELRMRHGHLGLRLGRASTAAGLPLPRGVLEALVAAAASEQVRLLRGQGIVVVDLRPSLPEALDLTVVSVQVEGRCLDLWLAPGGVYDLPSAHARLEARGVAAPPDLGTVSDDAATAPP